MLGIPSIVLQDCYMHCFHQMRLIWRISLTSLFYVFGWGRWVWELGNFIFLTNEWLKDLKLPMHKYTPVKKCLFVAQSEIIEFWVHLLHSTQQILILVVNTKFTTQIQAHPWSTCISQNKFLTAVRLKNMVPGSMKMPWCTGHV